MFEEILSQEIQGKHGSIGQLILNRPQALNACNQAMCEFLYEQLSIWAEIPRIKAVIIQSNSPKAFCAGGDIRQIYYDGLKNPAKAEEFFWHEYRLNYLISQYQKPYIALLDGITMGGGVGISHYASHRIASERLIWAMPETTIGFVPDVGASYFLPRCPSKLGSYLALTSQRLQVSDAFYAGLIDAILPSDKFAAFTKELTASDLSREAIDFLITKYQQPPQSSELIIYQKIIDACFASFEIDDILQNLAQSEWGQAQLGTLTQKSPTSLKVALAQLQRGSAMDLADCLRMEYQLTTRFLNQHDFYEGVRALLIDKDKNPSWNPKTLEEINTELVESYFLPITKELLL